MVATYFDEIMDIAWDLWQYRNGIVHSNEKQLDKDKILLEVECEYLKGFYHFPLSDCLQHRPVCYLHVYKKRWRKN